MNATLLLLLLGAQAPEPTDVCGAERAEIARLTAENERLKAEASTDTPSTSEAESAGAANVDGFGKVKWGQGLAAVRKAYPALTETGNFWSMVTDLAGRPVVAAFFFDSKDRLALAMVMTRTRHGAATKYLDEHDELAKLLAIKYGAPSAPPRDVWTSTHDSDDDRGLALIMGRMARHTVWRTPSTDINLMTTGEKLNAKTAIRYASRVYGAAVVAEIERKQASDL